MSQKAAAHQAGFLIASFPFLPAEAEHKKVFTVGLSELFLDYKVELVEVVAKRIRQTLKSLPPISEIKRLLDDEIAHNARVAEAEKVSAEGEVTALNFWDRAHAYGRAKYREGTEWPAVSYGTPEFIAWWQYFAGHVRWVPASFRMIVDEKHGSFTVPELDPAAFAGTFKATMNWIPSQDDMTDLLSQPERERIIYETLDRHWPPDCGLEPPPIIFELMKKMGVAPRVA
jgi:hypothetical protein